MSEKLNSHEVCKWKPSFWSDYSGEKYRECQRMLCLKSNSLVMVEVIYDEKWFFFSLQNVEAVKVLLRVNSVQQLNANGEIK
jgi:hypothetical protein